MLKKFHFESEALRKEISEFVVHLNIGWSEAWNMSYRDRQVLAGVFQKKNEAEAKAIQRQNR